MFSHRIFLNSSVEELIMKSFTEHPTSVGETYFEHMKTSFSFGFKMLTASIGCFLHGVFPFLCVKTGSGTVTVLHQRMVTHRHKSAKPCPPAEQVIVSGMTYE